MRRELLRRDLDAGGSASRTRRARGSGGRSTRAGRREPSAAIAKRDRLAPRPRRSVCSHGADSGIRRWRGLDLSRIADQRDAAHAAYSDAMSTPRPIARGGTRAASSSTARGPAPAPARMGRPSLDAATTGRRWSCCTAGWTSRASFQFVVDALRRASATCSRSTGAASARSDTPRGRHLLVPRVPGRPRARPRRAVRRARARRRPARPQHGRQRRDALRRHAARRASAGSSTSKASACRDSKPAQAPARIARWLDELKTPMQLRPYADRRRRRRAPARRPTRCCAPTAPPGSRRTGRGRPRDGDGRARPPRRRRPQADEPARSRRSTTGSSAGSGSPRRCCGSRATAPTSRVWWGDRYTKAEFHERLNVVADARAPRRRPGRPHAAPRPARGHRRGWSKRSCQNRALRAIASRANEPTMDVEHINAIGNRLADLTPAHGRPPGVSLTTIAKRSA